VSSPLLECAGCLQQGHARIKTLHQQNPLLLNWWYRLMQVDLCNGCKMGNCRCCDILGKLEVNFTKLRKMWVFFLIQCAVSYKLLLVII